MGPFSRAKDRLVEQVALAYLNNTWLGPYGRANSLEIDSTAKTISIEVDLKGEASPLKIELLDYEIMREDDRFFATVKEVRTSREWLTKLAADHLTNSRFEVPAAIGRVLMTAL